MCLGGSIHKYLMTHIISLFGVNLGTDLQFKFKMVRGVYFPKHHPTTNQQMSLSESESCLQHPVSKVNPKS